MRDVAARFPDDATVQALFAEALMDTMPWDYWTADGSPKPATQEVLDALERAMAAEPDHPLALHLWIHAVEKQRPELGVNAAERLGPLVPAAGHLVHMPGHIWIRVGRYHDAVVANQKAVLADDDYLAQCHAQGLYPIGYVPHNHHFLWVAAMLGGEKETALAVGPPHGPARGHDGRARHGVPPALRDEPALRARRVRGLDADPRRLRLRLATSPTRRASGTSPAVSPSHGRAASTRRSASSTRSAPLRPTTAWASSSAGSTRSGTSSAIAVPYLAGEVAAARGDADEAVRQFEGAVRLEDALTYDEPPPWALPSRWALGRVLLDADRPTEAEAVYRADLAVYSENGRALAGLTAALRAQGRSDEADALGPRIEAAWRYADVPLAAARS